MTAQNLTTPVRQPSWFGRQPWPLQAILIGTPLAAAMFFWVRFAAPSFVIIASTLPPWSGNAFFVALLISLGFYVDHLFPEDLND